MAGVPMPRTATARRGEGGLAQVEELRDRDRGADLQEALGEPGPPELREVADEEHVVGKRDAPASLLAQEIGAARENAYTGPLAHDVEGIGQVLREMDFSVPHGGRVSSI